MSRATTIIPDGPGYGGGHDLRGRAAHDRRACAPRRRARLDPARRRRGGPGGDRDPGRRPPPDGPAALEQPATIRFCRTLGFTLDEIRGILAAPRGRAQTVRWGRLVDAKIAELEAVVAGAGAMAVVRRARRDCGCVGVSECAARASAWEEGAGGPDPGR